MKPGSVHVSRTVDKQNFDELQHSFSQLTLEIIHSRYLPFSQCLAQLKGCFLDQADIRSNCLKLNCSTQVLIEGSNISSKRSFEPKQNQRHPYFQNHCTFYMPAAAFRTSVYGEKYYAKPSMAGAKSSRLE